MDGRWAGRNGDGGRWSGRHYGRHYGGVGVGFAFGGPSYYDDYYYGGGPYAYGYSDGFEDYAAGDSSDASIEYCMQRFRSYDLNSQTYLGYDGLRHSCP